MIGTWIQDTFIENLNLEGLERQRDCWNFRCPICGDSASDKHKKRAYLLSGDHGYRFYCHNCGASLSFLKFLDEIDPETASKYRFQIFRESGRNSSQFTRIEVKHPPIHHAHDLPLKKISSLPKSHQAMEYLKSRLIPEESFSSVSWCDDIPGLIEKIFPGKYRSIWMKSGIVWELRDISGSLAGFQTRTIHPARKDLRFFKACNPGGFFRKGLGLPEVITEGPVDAMFLGNCAAACSASLMNLPFMDAALFWDQEPRNHEIVSMMHKALSQGRKVVILPSEFHNMDINDIVRHTGFSGDDLMDLIRKYSFSGLAGKVRLSEFRRGQC